MSSSKDSKITAAQVLVPVCLISLVVFLFTVAMTVQTFQMRDALRQAKEQQVKPLEELQKVQTQLDALALGTKRLANQGDKNAQTIIDSLKQAGITVSDAAGSAPAAGHPAAAPAPSMPAAPPMAAPPKTATEPESSDMQ